MFQLSRQVDYALQLVCRLATLEPGAYLSLKKFSHESTISFLFLQKIARSLRQAEIINSVQGSQGGYYLLKKADTLSLKNIVEAVEGSVGLAACTRGEICSKEADCQIKPGIHALNLKLVSHLSETTVADIASAA